MPQLYGRYANGLAHTRRLISLDEAPHLTLPDLHLTLRWYPAPGDAELNSTAGAYRFCPVFDFDCAEAPSEAISEAMTFAGALARATGLELGYDVLTAQSGLKGAKVFLLWLTPVAFRWREAFALYCESLREIYRTIDVSMPLKDIARWLGARHPKTGAYQVPIGDDPNRQIETADVFPCSDDPPSQFKRWLDDIRFEYELQRLIDTAPDLNKRRSSVRYRGIDWLAELTAAGIPFVDKIAEFGVIRIKRCPFCGHRDAAVGKTGWLRCYRESCQAHQGVRPSDACLALGIDPPKPTGKASLLAYRPKRPIVSLEEARRQVAEVMANANGTPTLIRATPGVGKTHHALLEALDFGKAGQTIYAGPTREMADEAARFWNRHRVNLDRAAVLLPRTEETCYFMGRVRAAAQLGWSPGVTVCPSCPTLGVCPYYAQRGRARGAQLVCAPWESAVRFADQAEDARLVIDEQPFRAYLRAQDERIGGKALSSWVGTWAAELFPAVSAACLQLLAVLEKAKRRRPKRGKQQTALVGQVLVNFLRRSGLDDFVLLQAAAQVELESGALWDPPGPIPRRSVVDLIRLLFFQLRGQAPQPVALQITEEGPVFRLAVLDRALMGRPAQLLDAYGDPEIYAGVLGLDVNTVTFEVPDKAHYWLIERKSSRRAFADGQLRPHLYRQLEGAIEASPAKRERTLIVTHLSEIETPEFQAVAAECPRRHFGAGVGVNTYQNCDSAIIFGVPRMPPLDAWLLAVAILTPDSDETAGAAVRKLTDSLTRQEIAQQVHRIRPALSKGAPAVFIIGDVDCALLPEPILLKEARGAQIVYQALSILAKQDVWDPVEEVRSLRDFAPLRKRLIREASGRGRTLDIPAKTADRKSEKSGTI